MDISEGELAQVKEEKGAIFQEVIDNDIKPVIVKEEPREPNFFIKCEICNVNSDNEIECVHVKNDGLGGLKETDKLEEPSLSLVDGPHSNNSFKEDVEPKEEDSIMKLIDEEVTVKEEEYLDSPEYLSTEMDFVECDTGKVKTEDDNDIFYENIKIESMKEELTDNEASMSSDMFAQDEDSNEDVQPGTSKESTKVISNRKGTKYCLVPGCGNSIISTPKKLFLPLPRDKKGRQSWQLAIRLTEFVNPRGTYYCCEDHFKLEEDAENYMQFKMMGNVKLKIKPGVVPRAFVCQRGSGRPRECPSKRRLPDVVEEACASAKKSRATQAKDVRDQATQTEYHRFMKDVAVQVNLFDDEELKQLQPKSKKVPKKRTRKSR